MNAKTDSTGMELAPINTQEILITERGIDFANFGGLWTVANMILKAKMAPEGLNTPHAIALVMARGRSVGLDPFQSMESMAVVNGRVMIWGDAPLAIARQHPAWDESGFGESLEHDGKNMLIGAVCTTQRKGGNQRVTRFTVEQASRAKLWGKAGPWTFYPERMLMFRARGYALRDNFGDALKGLAIRETFDEEVDGKTPVTSGDELRTEIDKRKAKTRDIQADQNNGAKVKPLSQIITEANQDDPTIADRVAQLDTELSELDIARDLLKGIYDRIPLKQDPIGCLKKASMEDGTWIDFSHIEAISDVDYLNRIAAKLEEYASETAKTKAQ